MNPVRIFIRNLSTNLFGKQSYPIRSLTTETLGINWTNCWKCKSKHHSELFCPSCKIVQCTNCTTTKLNYFQVLKNEVSFDVSLSKLKPYYIKLQSMLHPDRYANTSDLEQDYSTTQSALVNEAYKTISDPLLRGLYILELNGHELDSEIVESDNNILNDIFILNFEVDECDYKDELTQLLEQVEEDISKDTDETRKFFTENNFEDAKRSLIKLKYRNNIKKKIENKIFNLQF